MSSWPFVPDFECHFLENESIYENILYLFYCDKFQFVFMHYYQFSCLLCKFQSSIKFTYDIFTFLKCKISCELPELLLLVYYTIYYKCHWFSRVLYEFVAVLFLILHFNSAQQVNEQDDALSVTSFCVWRFPWTRYELISFLVLSWKLYTTL